MSYGSVQHTSGTSFPVTISSTGAGNLLVFLFIWEDPNGSDPTFTGYNAIGTKATDAFNYSYQCFYKENIASGVTSIAAAASWSNGTPTPLQLIASEYSGIATSSSLITYARQAIASPGAGTNASTSGTSNVTSQPALIYGIAADALSQTTFTSGTGFTDRYTSATYHAEVEDKRVTSTGNQAATFTGNPTGAAVWMVAFAEAAGGGGASAKLLSQLSNQGGF